MKGSHTDAPNGESLDEIARSSSSNSGPSGIIITSDAWNSDICVSVSHWPLTYTQLPYGHDGWVVNTASGNCNPEAYQFQCNTGPVQPDTGLGGAIGDDLCNITMAVSQLQQVNNGEIQPIAGGPSAVISPYCTLWMFSRMDFTYTVLNQIPTQTYA